MKRAFGLGLLVTCLVATAWYGLRAATGDALAFLVFPASLAIGATIARSAAPMKKRGAFVIASGLTYLCASLAYAPVLAEALERDVARANGRDPEGAEPSAIAYGVALPLSCVTPVLLAFESPREEAAPLAATLVASAAAGLVASRRRPV